MHPLTEITLDLDDPIAGFEPFARIDKVGSEPYASYTAVIGCNGWRVEMEARDLQAIEDITDSLFRDLMLHKIRESA